MASGAEGPTLEINLPSGWGEAELRALLAPVDDVQVSVLPYGMARIRFTSEDGARKAAMLMESNEMASRSRSPMMSRSPSPLPAVSAAPTSLYHPSPMRDGRVLEGRPTPPPSAYGGAGSAVGVLAAVPQAPALYSPSRRSASPVSRDFTPPILPLPEPPPHTPYLTCAPAVSVTLLAAHRNTWRLVETLHVSLIDLAKAGPLHKADTLLQRLQIATLARQVEEQTAECEKLKRKLEENKKALSSMGVSKNVTYDIQKQLTEAAGMIQSTQKQLQEARERMKRADESKEESKRSEAEARRQLQDAIRTHSKELDMKTQQAANLSSKLAFFEMLRSVEYGELDERMVITQDEKDEWAAATSNCCHSLIAVFADETKSLSSALQQEVEDKVQLRKLSEKQIAEVKDAHERALEATRRETVSAQEALEQATSEKREREAQEQALHENLQMQEVALQREREERGSALEEMNIQHAQAVAALKEDHAAALAAVEESHATAQSAHRQEVDDLNEQNADLTNTNLDLHAQLEALQGKYDELMSCGRDNLAELEPLKQKNFELQDQLERATSKLSEVSSRLEADVAKAQDEAQRVKADADAQVAQALRSQSDARIEALLAEHQTIIRTLEAAHAAEMRAKDEEVLTAGCERDSLRQQGESLLKNTQQAAETTIQDQQVKIDALSEEIRMHAEAAARELEEKKSLIADHRRQTAEFTALVARLRTADEEKATAIVEKQDLQRKIDDLVGELSANRRPAATLTFDAACSTDAMPVLAEEERARIIAAAETDKQRMDATARELQAQIAVHVKQIADLQGERSAKNAEVEMWRKEATMRGDACEEVARLDKKVEFLMERENQLKNALRKSGAELDQLASTFHATQASLQAKSATIESLTSNLRLVTAELDKAKANHQDGQWFEEQHRTLSSEVNEANSELRRQKLEVSRLKDELERRIDEYGDEEEHHRREVAKLKDTIAKQKERIEKLNDEAQSSRVQLGKAAASLEEAVKAHTAESTSRQQSIRHQLMEEERLKAVSREHQEQLVTLRASLHGLSKDLETEKARVRDLEALCKTATENYRQTKEDADFLTSENKQLKYDLQQTKIQRSGDAKASAALHKKIADERDEFEKQVRTLTSELNELKSRSSFLESEESQAQGTIELLNEELDTLRDRLRNAQQGLGDMKEREAKLTKALAQAHARCDTLEEEIRVKLAAPPPEPPECKQCAIFQAARHLQQEVMTGLQTDAANAAADAEAARLTLTDYEARNTRLETELASMRMIVADNEAHIARLEARPTEEEYARVAARVTAAEAAAAAMESDARTALDDAAMISNEMQDKSAEIKRLHTQLSMMEQHGRDTEGVLRDTIDNQERALQATHNASYVAERDDYPADGVGFTLNKDGTFGRGQVEGYWYLEPYNPPDGQVGGLELRLLWSNENKEDLMISDTHGMTWVGRGNDGFKLTVVGSTPDWFKAEVFRKCLEAAESRAAQAQWKLQSAVQHAPHARATSPTRGAGAGAYQALAGTAGSPVRGMHSPLVDLAGYAAQPTNLPPPPVLGSVGAAALLGEAPPPLRGMSLPPGGPMPPVVGGGYSPAEASPTPPSLALDTGLGGASFAAGASTASLSHGLTPPLIHGRIPATASPAVVAAQHPPPDLAPTSVVPPPGNLSRTASLVRRPSVGSGVGSHVLSRAASEHTASTAGGLALPPTDVVGQGTPLSAAAAAALAMPGVESAYSTPAAAPLPRPGSVVSRTASVPSAHHADPRVAGTPVHASLNRLPSNVSAAAQSHGARSAATDAHEIESNYSQQFPTADRTVVSGLAHQVAEGTMSDAQATQMLTDIVNGDDDF